jgi:hypothetical protein
MVTIVLCLMIGTHAIADVVNKAVKEALEDQKTEAVSMLISEPGFTCSLLSDSGYKSVMKPEVRGTTQPPALIIPACLCLPYPYPMLWDTSLSS